MSKEPQIQEEEVKTKVAKRMPPGDRWCPCAAPGGPRPARGSPPRCRTDAPHCPPC